MRRMRGREQQITRTERRHGIAHAIVAAAGGDDIEFVPIVRRLRTAGRPRRHPHFEVAIAEGLGRFAPFGYGQATGNGKGDHQILKFTPDGKFLMQIGKANSTGGSNSTTQLGLPAHMITDDAAGELYVADGYGNRRIVVFDAKSGAYKRHWGAYGEKPSDDALPKFDPKAAFSRSFANPVHCVRTSNDGLVYVCDRVNNRVQIFKKDGAFVKEFRVSADTLANGAVWDLVLSRDRAQKFIFMADGNNNEIVVLERATGKVLSSFGQAGRMAGQFKWVHNLAIDSKGALYTAEVGTGRRAQKFVQR